MQIKDGRAIRQFFFLLSLSSILLTGCPSSENGQVPPKPEFPNHVIGKWRISHVQSHLHSPELETFQAIVDQKDSQLLFNVPQNGKATLEFRKFNPEGKETCSLTLHYDIWYCCAQMRKIFFMTEDPFKETPAGCIQKEFPTSSTEDFATRLRDAFTPNLPDEFSVSEHHFTHSSDHLDLELPYGAPKTWMKLEPANE